MTRGRAVPGPGLGLGLAALGLALTLTLALGCQGPSAYPCASSSQCVAGDQQGACTDGFCAFPDPSCPGGMRFEPNAGDGRGGTCVPELPAPPPPCGGVGEACCSAEGPQGPAGACGDQAYCSSGTCAACISDLAFGRRFSCVLAHDRTVQCAGENAKGQLGFGIAGVPSARRMEVRVATSDVITDAVAIGAGREHACAVRAGGGVWCWGANGAGQLGNNTTAQEAAAVAVVRGNGTPLTGIIEVGGGYDFTCARDTGGGVWCWGNNDDGALGDGTVTSRSTAAPVLEGGAPLSGALALEVGASMACVRKADDARWCWGSNGDGQFGDGTKTDHPSPVLLATTPSLALGNWHTCYLEADGTIACFGWNGHARLGIGTGSGYSGNDHTTREKVLSARGGAPFTGAKQVVAGGVTCALMQDTSVYCWGDNHYGQSGTGQGETVPTKVRTADGEPLTGVERLIAGYTHVCAIMTGGEVLCWGRNNDGDLGTGVFGNRGFPARIESACL